MNNAPFSFLAREMRRCGNAVRRSRLILRDDRAQAMTEYVIVIPVVLLMFFSAVQTMIISQVIQLGNYAAFAAARSYATEWANFDRDGGNPDVDARDRARMVACMVMAPISTGVGEEIPQSFMALRNSADGSQDSRVHQGIMEGLAVALVYRIENFDVTFTRRDTADSTGIIRVSFNYMLPIVLPSLNEMWGYLHQRRAGTAHMDDLPVVYTGNTADMPSVADFPNVLSGWQVPADAGLAASLNGEYQAYVNARAGVGTAGPLTCMRIPLKCSIGFEPQIGQIL